MKRCAHCKKPFEAIGHTGKERRTQYCDRPKCFNARRRAAKQKRESKRTYAKPSSSPCSVWVWEAK